MAKTKTIYQVANPKLQAGYTLVELLVVLAIIAVTTAVIAPRLITNNPNSNAKNNSLQLVSLYKKGRNLAIRTGVSQVVIIDTDNKTAWLSDQNKIIFADSIDIDTITAETESDTGLSGIRFFPDGVSTGGEITISSDKTSYIVSVIWANAEVRLESAR
ncbi:MAG: prepilin-type N-terminal cleavage/methylation domain-containing protein [Robiginitomaculum sp.]|jgi:general secretion pathway protein H|nr:prepilin-type N-terminal cleavage/methylation domain-containing protein [Robiginitomaculum sp.]